MVTHIVGDATMITAESYESLHKSISEFYEKLKAVLEKDVLPAWEELLEAISRALGYFGLQTVDTVNEIIDNTWDILKKCVPFIQSYFKVIHKGLKPLNETAQEIIKASTEAIEDFLTDFRGYMSKIPTMEALLKVINEHVKKLQIKESALKLINMISDKLNILPLTQESFEFVNKLRGYAEAKLRNKTVDDLQIIQELNKMLLGALNSFWSSLDFNSPAGPENTISSILTSPLSLPLDYFNIFSNISNLLSIRLSIVNLLFNENWESIFRDNNIGLRKFYQDFDLHGHIVDGHQIITFDKQQYSFPGTCKYILTQDSVDNNFTVIAHLNNGKLKTIVLVDRDENYVEITDSGALKIDGNQVEFPQHFNGIHAWRLFYTISLYSEYGVEVTCTQDLKVCHIKVNGFYTSKTRGLLGNGNAEPSDDFMQVDGRIAADYVMHGNGYAIGKCTVVVAKPSVVAPRSEICSEMFKIESPLAPGYIFENTTPYRARCDAAVAEANDLEKEIAACTIATAYGSALKMKKIPIRLPSRCLKCLGSPGQREHGEEFTVKIPGNKADVVFVVDMGISPTLLKNLIAPTILEVRDSLKTRGFHDVQIGVIAFNESQIYPAVLTSDGGKTNYQGNIADVQLNGPKSLCLHCTLQEAADSKGIEILKKIEFFLKGIVPQSDEKALNLALDFPFRAGSAKSIVAVRSNTLEFADLFKLARVHLTYTTTNFNGALLNLIGPVNGLSLEGIPKDKVVGFNSRLVATLDGKDIKKRQKLQFQTDIGIEFVLNSGGWIFATQNFDQLKQIEQKKALNQVANTLADTLFRTEIVTNCKCESVYGLYAQHRCVIKSSNFSPNKKIKTK